MRVQLCALYISIRLVAGWNATPLVTSAYLLIILEHFPQNSSLYALSSGNGSID